MSNGITVIILGNEFGLPNSNSEQGFCISLCANKSLKGRNPFLLFITMDK